MRFVAWSNLLLLNTLFSPGFFVTVFYEVGLVFHSFIILFSVAFLHFIFLSLHFQSWGGEDANWALLLRTKIDIAFKNFGPTRQPSSKNTLVWDRTENLQFSPPSCQVSLREEPSMLTQGKNLTCGPLQCQVMLAVGIGGRGEGVKC